MEFYGWRRKIGDDNGENLLEMRMDKWRCLNGFTQQSRVDDSTFRQNRIGHTEPDGHGGVD